MSDEKICFQQFKDYLKEEAPRRRWKVLHEENDYLLLRNEERTDHKHEITLCAELTQVMKDEVGEQCFVYRFHRIRGTSLDHESYRMNFIYNNDMYQCSLFTKNNDAILKKDVTLTKVNECWLSRSKPLPIPSSLQSVCNHFETLIKELPEFRLHYATGLM